MSNSTEAVKKKAARLSVKTMVVVGIFILAGLGFALIANEMVIEKENQFDLWAFARLRRITNTGMTGFMEAITFLGSSYFLFPAYFVMTLFFLLRKDWKYSINIASVGIWSTVILIFLKTFFGRERPTDPLITNVAGFSFPSGHSFSSFTFFGLLIYITVISKLSIYAKYIFGVLLFLIAVLIAVSRVYLHVHYASDVIAGFFLATIWLISSFVILQKIDKQVDRRNNHEYPNRG